MPHIWLYSLASVLLVSALSLAGAATLFLSRSLLERVIFILVSLSVGALYGDAFIHLIPEVLESGVTPLLTSLYVLGGICIFFILEKFLRWRHQHGDVENEDSHGMHTHHIGPLVLIGDGVHNFIDGVIIGVSYLISVEVGIATTIAVIFHEIPQEIGDFGLLLHAGFSQKKALLFNFVSASFAILGVLVSLLLGPGIESIMPIALAFAAGGFIYIAGSDLVPELHKTKEIGKSILQLLSIFAGVGIMLLLLLLE